MTCLQQVKNRNYPVWSSHTAVSGRKWGHVIAILLAAPFQVTPAMLPLDIDLASTTRREIVEGGAGTTIGAAGSTAAAGAAEGSAVGTYLQWTGWGPVSNITVLGEFSAASPIALPKCNASDFQLYHAAPLFDNKLALLGEPSKWVPVATKRVLTVNADATSLTVLLSGDPFEVVSLAFADATSTSTSSKPNVVQVDCTLSKSGAATATFDTSGVGTC